MLINTIKKVLKFLIIFSFLFALFEPLSAQKDFKYARDAMFCLTPLQESATQSERYKGELKLIEDFREVMNIHRNKSMRLHVALKGGASPTHRRLVSSIKLTRINPTQLVRKVTEEKLPDQTDHTIRNLRNWVHISVKTRKPINSFYFQSICGPMGVPCGTFSTDLICSECGSTMKATESNIIPCFVRPKSAIVHPNVYTFGGKRGSTDIAPRDEFHFHFNWIDAPCHEVITVQFLVLAIQNENIPETEIIYELFRSEAYDLHRIDSLTGVPYPIAPFWTESEESVQCHSNTGTGYESLELRLFKNSRGVIPGDYNYDQCLLTRTTSDYECEGELSVGPFKCSSTIPATKKAWGLERKRWNINDMVYPCDFCDVQYEFNREVIRGREQYEIVGTGRSMMIGNLDENLLDDDEDAPEQKTFQSMSSLSDPVDDENETDNVSQMDDSSSTDKIASSRIHTVEVKLCKDFLVNDDPIVLFRCHVNNWMSTVMRFHGILLITSFGMLMNISTFWTRFYKEDVSIKPGSGCFGIGNWLSGHIYLTYGSLAGMLTGMFLVAHVFSEVCMEDEESGIEGENYKFSDEDEIPLCKRRNARHQYLGYTAIVLFIVNYCFAWWRPNTPKLRKIVIWFHVLFGYFSKVFAILAIFMSKLPNTITSVILMAETVNIAMYIVATIIQYLEDKGNNVSRRIVPVPEALEAEETGAGGSSKMMSLLFYSHIGIQGIMCVVAIWQLW